jgi:mannose-1-phosphate guanylyltransferase
MNIVILAGGSGTRLWPLSRKDKAKQFNKLINGKTLLELTLDRFKGHFKKDKIFISTSGELCKDVLKSLPKFPVKNIIIEPETRDTAAAMGYVATLLSLRNENEPLAFIASDHYIKDNRKFINTLKFAEKTIKKTNKLIDIGILPNYPSTAFGYTKIGKLMNEKEKFELYEFRGHKEKPRYKIAQKYIRSGQYLWHANYYMWTPKMFLKSFKKYSPEIFKPLNEIKKILKEKLKRNKQLLNQKKCYNIKEINNIYNKIPKNSIDYALMEKINPKDVCIIKGEFGWSDVGSWNDLHTNLSTETDQYGNYVRGKWEGVDTSKCFIYTKKKHKLIATIGIDDMVVIDTKDALLICSRGRSQDVKKIIERLKKSEEGKKYL